MVKDVNKSVAFYLDVLGFKFIMGVPQGSRDILTNFEAGRKLDHSLVRSGTVEFMFHATFAEEFPEFKGKSPNASLSIYIVVEDVEKFYLEVKNKNKCPIYKDLHTQWYGMKEFYIKDPDGYILGFAQRA